MFTGQQDFFFNAAQRGQFLPQQQQQLQTAPSAQTPQFSNFFQQINSGPFSPFRSQDISSSSQPQFQSFQQTFPSQPNSFQLPPLQSSVPTSQNFNNFITSSRALPQAQQSFQPIKPPSSSFQPSSSFRQQKQQQSLPSVPSATRSEPRFQFSPFTSGEAQPPRSNFQNNVPVSTFQAPQAFSEVFQDDTPAKQQFNSFVNGQLQKDNINDFIPQSRWRNTNTNTDIDTNRLQRKPQPTSRTTSLPQSRIPAFASNQDDENDSNSLGQQSSDYDETPKFFKQAQTPITKQNNFQRNKPVDLKRDPISPKTRFDVSTYRPQHQFIPRDSIEDEAEEDLDNGEEEEEYIDEPAPLKPVQPVRSTTEAIRTDSRYRPTTYSPSFSRARFINNQSNRQSNNIRQNNLFNSQPEVTTFRSKLAKNIATNTITKDTTRNNSTIIPVTLKKQFKITGPVKNTSTFDVVVMNKDHTFVTEDNFKGFVDSASIDVTDIPHVSAGEPNISDEESGGLQVAVEPSSTTKKNVPTTTTTTPAPSFSTVTATSVSNKPVPTSTTQKQKVPTSVSPPDNAENPTSTESWVIVASVQTSRSVSGARFIPSGAVKQEELPKPLAPKSKENEDDVDKTTPSRNSSSTESIIDKLDRVQSELSSGILTGGFNPSKTDELDMPEKTTTESTTSTSSTTPSSSEEEESPSTSRFVPSSKRFTTTSKPVSKSSGKTSLKDSIQFDEELVGLLPPGFKPRTSTFTKKSTTTTRTTATAPDTSSEAADTTTPKAFSNAKSLLPKLKPKIKFEDVKAFVPAGYTPPPEDSESTSVKPALDSILSKVKFDDVSALLPPGYKPDSSSSTEKTSKSFPKVKFEEPTALLPKGFKPQGPPSKNVSSILGKAKPVDISSFLPPGFKPTEEPDTAEDTVKKTSVSSVNEAVESSTSSTTTSSSKLVFPSRPPGSPAATRKNSTSSSGAPKPPGKGGSLISQPKIQKGWPVR